MRLSNIHMYFCHVFFILYHRYRDERAALERAVRLAKDRNDRHAAKAKAAAAAHNEDNASNLGSGSAMMVEGAGGNNNGGAKYEISSDEGSSSSDGDGNTDDMNGLSAVQGSGMSEEDELALLEAKERIRRQKELRLREVLTYMELTLPFYLEALHTSFLLRFWLFTPQACTFLPAMSPFSSLPPSSLPLP